MHVHYYIAVAQFFWALGAISEAILALVIMTSIDDDNLNWRWLLGLSAVPVGLLTFIFPVSTCVTEFVKTEHYCAMITE